MITKCCIVCLSMTASTLLGIAYAKRKKGKVEYFRSCVRLTETLIAEISFRRENLVDVLTEFAQNDTTELKQHITEFCAAPYAPYVVRSKSLRAEERKTVSEFMSALGTNDAATEIFALENYNKRFEDMLAAESEKYGKTGSVSVKLSVLIGLAIGILIL